MGRCNGIGQLGRVKSKVEVAGGCFHMKQSCRNCHFLSTSYVVGASTRRERFVSWSAEERNAGHIDDLHDYDMEVNACCQRGIWHTGHDLSTFDFLGTVSPVTKEDIKSILKDELDRNRKDDCFFVPHYVGMSFDGAIEIHRIRYETRNLRQNRSLAVKGLWISGCAALLSGCAAVLSFFGRANVARFFEGIFKSMSEWFIA